MTKKPFIAFAIAFVFAGGLAAAPALAADEDAGSYDFEGIYLGGGVGLADSDGGGDKYASRIDSLYYPCRWMGFELGYAKIDAGTDGQEPDGLHISALPTYPLPWHNLSVYGQVGTLIGTFDEADGGESTKAEIAYGAGVAWHVLEKVVVRLGWEHIDIAVDEAEAFWLTAYYKLN
jgi:opacity protein-like surface antigen